MLFVRHRDNGIIPPGVWVWWCKVVDINLGGVRHDAAAVFGEQTVLGAALNGDGARIVRQELIEELRTAISSLDPRHLPHPNLTPALFDPTIAAQHFAERAEAAANKEIARAGKAGIIQPIDEDAAPVDLTALTITEVVETGLFHLTEDTELQDCTLSYGTERDDLKILLLSDGVSSVPLSKIGARILTHAAAAAIDELLSRPDVEYIEDGSFMNARFLAALHCKLCEALVETSLQVGLHPLNACELAFSATLQIAVITPQETAVLSLSDGFIGAKHAFQAMEVISARKMPDFNTPPLLCRAIEREAREQLKRQKIKGFELSRHARNLFDEAEAFKVILHGPTSEVLKHMLALSSDGLCFTDGLEHADGRPRLPVLPYLTSADEPLDKLHTAINLFHIYRLAEYRRQAATFYNVWSKLPYDRLSTESWNALPVEVRKSEMSRIIMIRFLRRAGFTKQLQVGMDEESEIDVMLKLIASETVFPAKDVSLYLRSEHDRLLGTVLDRTALVLQQDPQQPDIQAALTDLLDKSQAIDALKSVCSRLKEALKDCTPLDQILFIRSTDWARPIRERLPLALAQAAAEALQREHNFDVHLAGSSVGDDFSLIRIGPLA
ncbi:MAG: protein phosphatase 2C domain-containing protein [Oligoflexia bacterium]|nr:protein phosphatase 2C domain-containing protein [Oligoflexia bacterium]